jgi:sugar-specific transcriptional regulator TrmB
MDELFRKLGLNENEQEVYLAVLKAGKIAPNQVARLTSINRTTVYSVAKKLEKLGLVAQDLGQKVHYLVATPPEKIVSVFEREERRVAEKKKVAQELAKELENLRSEKKYSVPRIRFIEENDLDSYLYEAYSRWEESVLMYGNIWWGYQDDSFTTHYQDWILWATKKASRSLEIRSFFNDIALEHEIRKTIPMRKMKIMPHGTSFDTSYWVAGDYILMAQTKNRPHYLVEIYDAVLARNQRELFKVLWTLAPEMSAVSKELTL